MTVGPALEILDVARSFGPVEAVRGVSLSVEPGEILALLGPSGCGKSTLLQLVAGLLEPDRGSIRIGGSVVTEEGRMVPPHKRRVGLVFQEHALFAHLTVAGNIGFGLAHLSKHERGERVTQLLDLVRLAGKSDRYVHELSGGEQQRVALARALAPKPAILALDEPFASLDRALTDDLRAEVVALLRAAGTPVLFVTHDPADVLIAADRVAVMRDGRIVQVGHPVEIHDRPVDAATAAMFGPVNATALFNSDGSTELLRPWEIYLSETSSPASSRGEVHSVRFLGHAWRLEVVTQTGEHLSVDLDRNATVPGNGAPVFLTTSPRRSL